MPLALPSKYIWNPITSQYLLHNHYSKAPELLPINTTMVALLLPFLPFTIFSKLINLNRIMALFSKSTSSLLSHSEKSPSNCNGYKVLSCMTYDSQCLCDIIFHNPTYFLFCHTGFLDIPWIYRHCHTSVPSKLLFLFLESSSPRYPHDKFPLTPSRFSSYITFSECYSLSILFKIAIIPWMFYPLSLVYFSLASL